MGRFGSAKTNSTSPVAIVQAMNNLIDLLDTGYATEATIGGKKVLVEMNPKTGMSIKVNGVKVFGINSSGVLFAQAISNGEDHANVMEIGSVVVELDAGVLSFGGAKFFYIQDGVKTLQFSMAVTEGHFYLVDADGEAVFVHEPYNTYMAHGGSYAQLTSAGCHMYMGVGAAQRGIGVDSTGAYKSSGGVKTYL